MGIVYKGVVPDIDRNVANGIVCRGLFDEAQESVMLARLQREAPGGRLVGP